MHKALRILTIIVCSTTTFFGQSLKNDLKLSISGIPLINTSKDAPEGINGFVLKTAFGYYISSNTSIDINFTYTAMNNIKVLDIDSYFNSYAFIPSFRNNFINTKKLRAFVEFSFGLGTIKYRPKDNTIENSEFQALSGGISLLSFGIGSNYYISDAFGIEFLIPYISTRNITSQKSNSLFSGIGPTLGVTYKIN